MASRIIDLGYFVSIKKGIDSKCRVGAIFLLRKDGAALMQLRDNKPDLRHAGLWVPPGGHANPGEEIQACAIREFFEETGYLCTNVYYLSSITDYVIGWPPYHLTFFGAIYDGLQSYCCNEGQDLKFLSKTSIPKNKTTEKILYAWDLAINILGLQID